ncbi:putative scf e3 ubiquitin ligase complex f-box protein grra [Erysiphe necator]|uniref:Putative scf e3 ubiquitin ligase complex f-box protein grra n=1 Tax=Uncinula necator TaxID=52586 RepID=A0A0B1P8I9_UNCNE|nr:putative scf e3 ubiquitin ligase complex f-box protein grra [Erysiphe necator]
MRGPIPDMDHSSSTHYRVGPELERESQSLSSNSPLHQDYEESDFYAEYNDSRSSLGATMTVNFKNHTEKQCSSANKLPAEVLISMFSKLSDPQDLLNCMRVSKKWARNCVDLLWHRPACTTWNKHSYICRTLSLSQPFFAYRDFIRRLNLAGIADGVNDGSVLPLAVCNRVERLTLTNCEGLSDNGLMSLLNGSSNLLALDISGDSQITERSMEVLANNCSRLQGLNITGCNRISSASMMLVAEKCRNIKRLKLNDCDQLDDAAVIEFSKKCPNMLEIDLHQCKGIGDEPVTALLKNGKSLRELRLANCDLISDSAFLSLPSNKLYEHLRILDLTFCTRLTDRAVVKIIEVAPRLRNLVFAKCRQLTDTAVNAISKLGKNLHYLHLGHCGQITDNAIVNLVASCNRIRYIDLGCCTNLTDTSVIKLASLPKLRRIGLVKCSSITDSSVIALAQSPRPVDQQAFRAQLANCTQAEQIRFAQQGWTQHIGHFTNVCHVGTSSLERVHLSYCTSLTLNSIIYLLNHCQKLTHLSLTGVQAFLRQDLEKFCRDAPPEFTDHQRSVFCVFSGQGVVGLRQHLNRLAATNVSNSLQVDRYRGDRRTNMIELPPNFIGNNTAHAILSAPNDIDDDVDGEDDETDLGVTAFTGTR